MLVQTITNKIDKAIEAAGITKTAFAVKIGVSRDTVYNWTDESIKFSTLLKICEVLRLDILDFIGIKFNNNSNLVNEPAELYTKGKKTIVKLRPHDKVYLSIDNRIIEIIHEN